MLVSQQQAVKHGLCNQTLGHLFSSRLLCSSLSVLSLSLVSLTRELRLPLGTLSGDRSVASIVYVVPAVCLSVLFDTD